MNPTLKIIGMWLLLVMFISLVQAVNAENNVTHPIFSVLAPQTYTLSHIFNDSNGTKENNFWPIDCYQVNSSTPPSSTCAVTRTLGVGETFVQQDAACDLRITAPTCTNVNVPNITHTVRWRVNADQNFINITNLNSNDSRQFSKSGNSFNYETEFLVQCPFIDNKDDKSCDEEPIDITDGQFARYCLKPFGTYGDSIFNLNNRYMNQTQDLNKDVGACRESNKILAAEAADAKARLESETERCNLYTDEYDKRIACERREQDLQSLKGSRTALLIHFIIDAIVAFVAIIYFSGRHMLKEVN